MFKKYSFHKIMLLILMKINWTDIQTYPFVSALHIRWTWWIMTYGYYYRGNLIMIHPGNTVAHNRLEMNSEEDYMCFAGLELDLSALLYYWFCSAFLYILLLLECICRNHESRVCFSRTTQILNYYTVDIMIVEQSFSSPAINM